MSNCKYIIDYSGGDFILEIPSISSSGNNGDFRESLLQYLSKSDVNPQEILKKIKTIEKQLVYPSEVKNFVVGQNSMKTVFRNISDIDLKDKLNHLNGVLENYWKNNLSGKNPIYVPNIVQCAFDENYDYEYNKEYDIIFINTVNGIDNENILKGSIERTLHLMGIENVLSDEAFTALKLSDKSYLKEQDIRKLYFNDSSIKRINIIDNITKSQESFKDVKEKTLPLLENRDLNYEPLNTTDIFNVKQGDLVLIGDYYSIFVDYYINGEGKYVIKTISPNSSFPEKTTLNTSDIKYRKKSNIERFSEYSIDKSGTFVTIKLPKDLYFNNRLLFNTIKRGDKFTIGRTDYTVLNQKGSVYIVENNKGEIEEIKPTNKVNSIKLNPNIHKNLNYKGENFDTSFSESKIISNNDRNYILENDVVEYDEKKGLVLAILGDNIYVKDLESDEIETISKYSVTNHFINNIGNKALIDSLKENVKIFDNINPFDFGDYLDSEYNWSKYYEGFPLKRGDFIIVNNKSFVIIDEHKGTFRVHDGERYLFISDLSSSIIASKTQSDPLLSKKSLNKNSYFVSNNPNQYNGDYESYPVKVIYNKNTGSNKVVPADYTMKDYYEDISNKIKSEKGYSQSDTLYSFKKNGISVKNSENTVFIQNVKNNFGRIFNYLIPGTFVRFESSDLKYWLIEKRVGDKFIISASFIRNGEIKTVKKFVNKSDIVSEVRLPIYAESTINTINTINDIIGIKESKPINSLKDYQSSEILLSMKDLLEKKYGININIVTKDESNLKAFVTNGEYFINIDSALISDPLHEFLHIVLASMKYSDPYSYRKIVESISNHPLFSEVSSSYKESNLDRLEETFIRLFSQTVSHEIAQSGIFSEESFNESVKLGIKNMFDLKYDLDNEYSYELLDTEVKEILTGFGSSLIENSESLYNKENSISMIEASSTIRKLLKSGELKEECNG